VKKRWLLLEKNKRKKLTDVIESSLYLYVASFPGSPTLLSAVAAFTGSRRNVGFIYEYFSTYMAHTLFSFPFFLSFSSSSLSFPIVFSFSFFVSCAAVLNSVFDALHLQLFLSHIQIKYRIHVLYMRIDPSASTVQRRNVLQEGIYPEASLFSPVFLKFIWPLSSFIFKTYLRCPE
jgi:hypothetical protein